MGKIIPTVENSECNLRDTNLSNYKHLAQLYLNPNTPRSEQTAAANAIIATSLCTLANPKPNLFSFEECSKAVANYLNIASERNAKPTMPGFCLALGVTRKVFIQICETGCMSERGSSDSVRLPKEVSDFFVMIREQYAMMVEGLMADNLIQPSAASFLLKNNSDYRDVSETKTTVVSAKVDLTNLAEKYKQELGDF